MSRILVNGEAEGRIPSNDRGFTLGDGLFETIAVVEGRPALWQQHMERLATGCRRLGIPQPDSAVLAREAATLIGDDLHGTLRLTWTRGPAPPGYVVPDPALPTRVLAFHPRTPAAGPSPALVLRTCDLRLGAQPALAGIKHLNRLEQVLARAEWSGDRFDDGLLLDQQDRVIEATASNLFAVMNGILVTPPLTECGVAGIMRATVLDAAARSGVPVAVEPIYPVDLGNADEVFLTNCIRGIRAVRQIDTHRYTAPGPLTRRMTELLQGYW